MFGKNQSPIRGKLGAFNANRDLLNKIKKNAGEIAIEGSLRSEVVLGNTNTINFSIQENVTNGIAIRTTEKRLKQSDKFMITEIGFFIGTCKKLSVNPTAAGSIILRTYPNSSVFTGVTGVVETEELQKIYNGYMNVQRDQTRYFENLEMIHHYRVTEAQQGVAVSTAPTTGLYQRDGHFNKDFGFRKLTNVLEIEGTKRCDFSISLPDTATMTSQNAQLDNIGILIVKGFLIQKR